MGLGFRGQVPRWMDRETRTFAERYYRGLRDRVPSGGGPRPSSVNFIQAPDAFSYADFVKGFLLPNLPCVFSSAFTEGWGSRRRWVTSEGKPDFEYLLQKYGRRVQTGVVDPGMGGRPGLDRKVESEGNRILRG